MDEIDLSEYLQTLSRRRGLIIGTAVIAVLVAFVALMFVPRTYRGKAVLLFPKTRQSSGLLSQLTGATSIADLGLPMSSEPGMYSEILKSRTLGEQVARELQLSSAGLDAETLQNQVEISITKEGGMEISCYAPTSWVKGGKVARLNRLLPAADDRDRAAHLASDLVNTYIRCLQDFDRRHALSTGRENKEFLEGEVAKTRSQLTDAEDALRRFRETHPVVPPPETASQQMQQVIDVRTRQIEAETELREAERSIQEAKSVIAGQEEILSASKVIQDNPVVVHLKSDLANAEVHRAQLLENLTEKHPDVVAVSQEIDKIEEKIRQEIAKVTASETLSLNPVRQALVGNLAALEIKKSGLQARFGALTEIMSRIESEISNVAKDQMQYLRLTREVKALEGVYTSLLTDLSKAKVSESKEPEGFTVLDWAIPEKHPVKPKMKLGLLGALVFGVVLGSFLALVQEARHPTKWRTQRAIESVKAGCE